MERDITDEVRYALSRMGILKDAGSISENPTELRDLACSVIDILYPLPGPSSSRTRDGLHEMEVVIKRILVKQLVVVPPPSSEEILETLFTLTGGKVSTISIKTFDALVETLAERFEFTDTPRLTKIVKSHLGRAKIKLSSIDRPN